MRRTYSKKVSFLIVVLIIIGLAGCLYIFLSKGNLDRPSPWVGKPIPSFSLPGLSGGELSSEELKGKPFLLTFFASWCFSCRIEHKMIGEISRKYDMPVYGIAYRDEPKNIEEWFSKYGNPFTQVGLDSDGDMGFEWGVRGVPETYLIDSNGVIQYHIQGALLSDEVIQNLEKAIRAAR